MGREALASQVLGYHLKVSGDTELLFFVRGVTSEIESILLIFFANPFLKERETFSYSMVFVQMTPDTDESWRQPSLEPGGEVQKA